MFGWHRRFQAYPSGRTRNADRSKQKLTTLRCKPASAKPTLDNPKGCLDWERIKQLPKDPSLIAEAEGKVVKVISQLILSLPSGHKYRVVLMQRPLPEVLKSQEEMLRRRGNADSNTDTSAIDEAIQRHLIEVNKWLASKENVQVSRILSSRIARTREPKAVAGEIAAFLVRSPARHRSYDQASRW